MSQTDTHTEMVTQPDSPIDLSSTLHEAALEFQGRAHNEFLTANQAWIDAAELTSGPVYNLARLATAITFRLWTPAASRDIRAQGLMEAAEAHTAAAKRLEQQAIMLGRASYESRR